jgi:predicted esterase
MKRLPPIALLGLALALFAITSCTRPPNPDNLIEALFASVDEASTQSAIEAIVAAELDPEQVANALREGPSSFHSLEPGWQIHAFPCNDGITRNVHLFVPTSYDPNVRHTLLLSLHGAVNQPAYTIDEFTSRYSMWESVAERDGFLVLMPHGDEKATWWSESGRQYIHDLLQWVKQVSNIDENKVFLAGFSDGAAGTYWMAFHDPTAWAGFIPIFGSVSSPERGPYQCYPSNLRHRPILASNGNGEPYIRIEFSLQTQLRDQGVLIPWVIHPTEHNLSQTMPYEQDRSAAFIAQTSRDPWPTEIEWRTATLDTGRCDWIRINNLSDSEALDRFEDVNLGWEREIFHFGAGLQYQGEERGFEVAGVEPGSIAQSIGLRQGDKLMMLGEEAVITNTDIANVMNRQLAGEPLTAEIIRDGEPLSLECTLPEIPVIYRRDLPTAEIAVQASGNIISVRTQSVGSFRILVSSAMFDLSQPIRVACNGDNVFDDIVQPDLAFMLKQWLDDRDRSAVFEGVIKITVSPALDE